MFDVATTFLIRTFGAAIAFALQILLARLLTTDVYGGYALAWTWLLALGSFGAMGFAESAVRFLPRFAQRGINVRSGQFQKLALVRTLQGSLILSLAMVVVAQFWTYDPTTSLVLLAVAVGLPFLALEYLAEGIARSFGRFRLVTTIVYWVRPLLTIGFVSILFALNIALTLEIVLGLLLVTIVSTTLALTLIFVRPNNTPIKHSTRQFWQKSSYPLLLVSGLEDLLAYADIILVGLLLGPESAALYFAASRVLVLAGFAHHAVYLVYGRLFSLSLGNKSDEQLSAHSRNAIGLTLTSAIVVAIGAAVAGPYLLAMFGSQFQNGYTILLVLAVAAICKAAAGQTHELLLVQGRHMALIAINGFSVMSAILFLFWGITSAGPVGAAAAMALTAAIRSSLLLWVHANRAEVRKLKQA